MAAGTRNKRRKAKSRKAEPQVKKGSEWVGVGQSGIHQSGLFARRDIPKDTRMIEYVGEKIIKAESERRGNEQDELGRPKGDGTVYMFTLNDRYDIDGAVDWNDAKNANHSCEPNAATDIIKDRIWLISARDIKKEEEIVYDYGFDLSYWRDHPCRCGSEKCVGYIVGDEYRKKLKKKIKAWEKKQAKQAEGGE
ncbi:MAG: SET domain-containing protein-lysine N-methyltransferase [Akkermansiaceae bacterium]|nr:SET domain-containing protein-lysine N-methyltransferase [Akkermansiaceae bacterium]